MSAFIFVGLASYDTPWYILPTPRTMQQSPLVPVSPEQSVVQFCRRVSQCFPPSAMAGFQYIYRTLSLVFRCEHEISTAGGFRSWFGVLEARCVAFPLFCPASASGVKTHSRATRQTILHTTVPNGTKLQQVLLNTLAANGVSIRTSGGLHEAALLCLANGS